MPTTGLVWSAGICRGFRPRFGVVQPENMQFTRLGASAAIAMLYIEQANTLSWKYNSAAHSGRLTQVFFGPLGQAMANRETRLSADYSIGANVAWGALLASVSTPFRLYWAPKVAFFQV
jgi:hypothetical protein